MRRKIIDESRRSAIADDLRLFRFMKLGDVATRLVPKLVRSAH